MSAQLSSRQASSKTHHGYTSSVAAILREGPTLVLLASLLCIKDAVIAQFGITFNYVESCYLKLPSWKLSDFL